MLGHTATSRLKRQSHARNSGRAGRVYDNLWQVKTGMAPGHGQTRSLCLAKYNHQAQPSRCDIRQMEQPQPAHLQQACKRLWRAGESLLDHHLIIRHKREPLVDQPQKQVRLSRARRAEKEERIAPRLVLPGGA